MIVETFLWLMNRKSTGHISFRDEYIKWWGPNRLIHSQTCQLFSRIFTKDQERAEKLKSETMSIRLTDFHPKSFEICVSELLWWGREKMLTDKWCQVILGDISSSSSSLVYMKSKSFYDAKMMIHHLPAAVDVTQKRRCVACDHKVSEPDSKSFMNSISS